MLHHGWQAPSPRACDCVVQTVVLGRFPLARAGDSYSDELRLLDLELEILSLKSQMLFALTSRDRCTAPRSHTSSGTCGKRTLSGIFPKVTADATVHQPCTKRAYKACYLSAIWTVLLTLTCVLLVRSSRGCSDDPKANWKSLANSTT